ncbi:hypothetical protein [Adhaeribacter soli]|uniref:Uncharacterized protein n=1 Tax=Adhaeribacter soli TaxID=2607655 RepID=A0A5N1J1S1_9BACT|nr:hypothetical protein [Adhaeribacter soli]KAA9340017.1 hypothetical protein F0P94_06610 [Adhaeribacter soli]
MAYYEAENELDLDVRWTDLRLDLQKKFGKRPDLNAILFLIGIQELGQGITEFTKEQKQDLMHIATCKVFSLSGFYELTHTDAEGWPHYRSVKPLPAGHLKAQERMLKWHILEYFDQL